MCNTVCFSFGFIAGLLLTIFTVIAVELLQYWDLLTFI
jgi:hypothetical protein